MLYHIYISTNKLNAPHLAVVGLVGPLVILMPPNAAQDLLCGAPVHRMPPIGPANSCAKNCFVEPRIQSTAVCRCVIIFCCRFHLQNSGSLNEFAISWNKPLLAVSPP